MRSKDYGPDVLATPWRRKKTVREVPAVIDDVVEHAASGFCGGIVVVGKDDVTLEDRRGKRRVFPLEPAGFMIDGEVVTLVRPRPASVAQAPARTASGSVAAPSSPARVAIASRLFVEGAHDAQLVERLWGDDLRYVGVVVEILDGADNLPDVVAEFQPGPRSRMGVLLDHVVGGSKESRIAATVASPHVLVRGHPFVDVWQAVKPAVAGLAAWPDVPRGQPWKETIAAHLGQPDAPTAWRHILSRVNRYTDLEPALLAPVEELIDFVTEPHLPDSG